MLIIYTGYVLKCKRKVGGAVALGEGGNTIGASSADEKVNVVRQEVGHLADDVSSQQIQDCASLRGSQDEARDASSGRNIDDGIGSGIAYNVAGQNGGVSRVG